jgi:hypothetical protein
MKRIFISITLLLITAGIAHSQSVYQPYSYDFYQKFNADAYSTKTRLHTAMKPFFVDDSLLMHRYNSIINYGGDGANKSFLYRKLFNEHLIDIKGAKIQPFMPICCPILT